MCAPRRRMSSSSETTIRRAPRSRSGCTSSSTLAPRRPGRRDQDHRPAGPNRGDRAMEQVGGRVRLDDKPQQLADLERDSKAVPQLTPRATTVAPTASANSSSRGALASESASCCSSTAGNASSCAAATGPSRPKRAARPRQASSGRSWSPRRLALRRPRAGAPRPRAARAVTRDRSSTRWSAVPAAHPRPAPRPRRETRPTGRCRPAPRRPAAGAAGRS